MMKKVDMNTIIRVVGVIAVVGVLFYFGTRGGSPVATDVNKADTMDTVNTAINPHDHNMGADVTLASLDNLVGKPMPLFSLADRAGNVYSADSLRGKNVILFFNEGLMCYPACWNQIISLSKDDRFKNSDTAVLSVVVDRKEDWQKAINKMPELGQANVIFDQGAYVSKEFGVLTAPSSMHAGSFPGHTYVIADKEGIIRYVFDDPNMGIRNDQLAAEIMKL